jgi:AcrR family transcriptional regulator
MTDRYAVSVAESLRERKKVKTRTAIQREALRLFRAQGYAATTIDQVAEAAEVAPSTVFRYFPAKEDLADVSDYHPLRNELITAFEAQPPELSPVEALRRAIRAAFESQSPADLAAWRERELLVLTVPELWVANLGNITFAMNSIAELFARRAGRRPDEHAIKNLSRAVCGTALAVWFELASNPELEIVTELDQALEFLAHEHSSR